MTNLQPVTWDVVVIGAGAAGLIAAIYSAERGRRTLLLEKNPRPGIKILMSGGTRCNLTHATDERGIVAEFGNQGSFLHSALSRLSPADLVRLVEDEGVATKVEETGKVFPESDRADDILHAFVRRLERSGACLALAEPAKAIIPIPNSTDPDDSASARFRISTPKRDLMAHSVIVTTGGRSYPGCGTSGDGYAWLESLGHSIVPLRPALTPITSHAEWLRELQGITLPDVQVRVSEPTDQEPSGQETQTHSTPRRKGSARRGRKPWLAERRGSLLFTHFGLSGPVVLDVSRVVSGHSKPQSLTLFVDLLPAVSAENLETKLREASQSDGRRPVSAILSEIVPRRLAETILQQVSIVPELRMAELSKAQRAALVEKLKQLAIPISGTMGFRKAEVTAGGVALGEVDSSTMESKIVPGLYLAGEILDLDGPIGGYNFQAAFSTGLLAGSSA